jgi:hypothetical protein
VEQQPPVLVCQGQGLHPVHAVQALSAQVAALAASKAAVPTGVPSARRPAGAWCMPSAVATDAAAAVSSE